MYGQSQVTLLQLPIEIQFSIIDDFDLAQFVDVEALKSLCHTCKHLRFIVKDNLRLGKSSKTRLHYERKILTNFQWQTLGDAAGYSRYAHYCRYLTRNIIEPTVQTCSEAYEIPLSGCDQIFSVALLIRAKLMGYGLDNSSTQLHRSEWNSLSLRFRTPMMPQFVNVKRL